MLEKYKSSKGVTLVALAITVIILLTILSISITTVIDENGIMNKTAEAKEVAETEEIKEKIQIEIIRKKAGNQGKITNEQLKEILKKYGEINYENDNDTIKSITTNEAEYEIVIKDIWSDTIDDE